MDYKFGEGSGIYSNEKEGFEFPSNIRQIGRIDSRTKVYMEDYVYTYIYQYARANEGSSKLGVLVGKHFTYDDSEVVIISGAIQGKYSENENGCEVFTDETWEYVNDQMKIYFRDYEIVGWVHTMSGYGGLLTAKDEEIHKKYFPETYYQLFVVDADDKMDKMFALNDSKNSMREVMGYFIYYDKNREMQEYMIENSVSKPKESLGFEIELGSDMSKTRQEYNDRIDAAKKIRSVLKEREEKVAKRNKARYRVLASVCGMLCFFCFLMGLGLINSSKRINRLETEVVSVQTKYTDISEQLQNNNVQSVFASQSTSVSENTSNNVESLSVSEEKVEEDTVKTMAVEDEKPKTYVVRAGDSLSYISAKFYGDASMVDEIMEANGMSNPNKIIVGKKIVLP